MENEGCKFCKGEKEKIYTQTGYTKKGNTKYGYKEITRYPDFDDTCGLRIIAGILHIDYTAYSLDSSFYDEIKINYCPFCGRKLDENN